ncbi:MAG: hypothetical protein EBY04_00055 [Actinobacteria bacterium]|nr:hypothetical protein [Actinomycetota bacterium]
MIVPADLGCARPTSPTVGSDVLVQASAHGAAQPAVIESSAAREFVVRWMTPQRRVAPGQSVVLYDATNRFVLGGGTAR